VFSGTYTLAGDAITNLGALLLDAGWRAIGGEERTGGGEDCGSRLLISL